MVTVVVMFKILKYKLPSYHHHQSAQDPPILFYVPSGLIFIPTYSPHLVIRIFSPKAKGLSLFILSTPLFYLYTTDE